MLLHVYTKCDYNKIFDLNDIKTILCKTIANGSTIDVYRLDYYYGYLKDSERELRK